MNTDKLQALTLLKCEQEQVLIKELGNNQFAYAEVNKLSDLVA